MKPENTSSPLMRLRQIKAELAQPGNEAELARFRREMAAAVAEGVREADELERRGLAPDDHE